MEAIRAVRRPVRIEFEKLYKELTKLLGEEVLMTDDVIINFKIFCEVFESLQQYDKEAMEQMCNEKVSAEEEDAEYDDMRAFKIKYEKIRMMKQKVMPEEPVIPYTDSIAAAGSGSTLETRLTNFKLPTIQMRKFSGQLIDWLTFWAQFEKIDEHPTLSGSDKLTYLIQLLEPRTDAYEIASGYPQTNDNYPKVVAALKKRYANQDLLLQVYIRQLLNLVISNVNAKERIPVKSLFLKLDSHLRALKSLNLEKADPATWLFPLVESCLPEKILDNWQRSPLSTQDGSKESPPRTRLDFLMAFVEKEVDIKQRIELTKSFTLDKKADSKYEQRPDRRYHQKEVKRGSIPTMSSFHNAEKQQQCVFCGKGNHKSKDCYRAKEMPYEEKMDILKKNRLCFRCCGPHVASKCPVKLECRICKRGHEAVICRELKRKSGSQSPVQPQPKRLRPETTTTSSNSNMECSGDVALQTLMVKIGNGDKVKIVRAFVDGGCQRSYILKKTAKEVSLKKVGMERVVHSLFGDNRTPAITHNKYEIQIGDLQNNFHHVAVVRDSGKLCGRLPNVEKKVKLREELHNKNVVLTDVGNSSEIELLIGGDVYAQIITGEICSLECGATAINTKLGWTLLGNVGDDEGGGESLSSMYLSMAVTDADITKLWDLETLGIREPAEEAVIKKKIELAREQYISNSIIKEDGKYVVKLPWKDDLPLLPTNRDVAFKRLQSASKKLQEKGLFGAYQQLLMEWEKEGFIERVRRDDNAVRVHYLPHRAVIKPDSLTTPVRPVFDASCRVGKSPSLNDCLFTGENLVQLIPGIHLLFREKKVGFVSDIRKAFQMIGVAEEDRDMMRFLFWEDHKMEKVVEYRHATVMFGATCSPFILAAVISHHLTNMQEEEKEMGMRLLSTLYVDNCAYSVDTPAEYFHFREKATELMRRAGMELRLWMSNVDEIEDETTRVISVLGLQWDRSSDELFVNVKKISVPEKVTKRGILSSIQKIFDPIGFTAPCVLPMKILLQRTWLNKMKWDEELPEQESRKFISWCHEVETLDKIRIPRVFSNGDSDRRKWTLHIFVDACKDSYAGAVFLRVEEENSVSVQLLAAKSRVAPVKKMTIPKLELMGCLVGVRLVTSIKNSLKIDGVPEYFWSDSTTALAWIRRNEMWGTFVGNRTKEINQLSKAEDWRHVPGEQNPADLPSRGCSPEQLFRSRWWEGPKWLYEDASCWPRQEENYDEQEISAERRKTAVSSCVVSFSILDRVQNSHSFASRVRIIGWVRRFLHNYLMKKTELRRNGDLTKDELNKAELAMIKQIQKEEFPAEGRSRLIGLEIIQDDWGILRVKTRLTHRKDLGSFRFPILLPNKREEIRQLIRDNHRMYCHAGVGFLVTKLRRRFWILKARHTVKGVISKCHRCRRYSAKSVVPEPAPLPLDRVKEAEVFEVVGVDLAGPLILKDGGKAWMVIFTCAVYRAVHLELVRKISTRAFINVLEKFSEKFRRPAIIYSDNGTNFRGTDNMFKKIDWDNVGQHETIAKIEWRFSPPTSSWWGGFWERLIRTVKDLLKRTVGKGSLCWSELVAVLKTVEDVMNERPLTYVSENPEDLEPLTPALFLHPFGNARLPEAELSAAENLRFRLNYVTTLRRELKSRFLREYLSLLVNRKPKKPTRELKKGELVFVGSDNTKRVEWPLGRIVEFLSSRVVKVKTAGGIFVRSVQRLYPLEADGESKEEKSVREYGVRTRSGRDVRRPTRFE